MTIKAEEIVGRKTLRAWLETRSIEDARIIAARVALRALPLIFAAENFDDQKNYILFQNQLLVNFRAAFILCVAIKFPTLFHRSAAYSATDIAATVASAAADVDDFIAAFVTHTSAFSMFVSHARQPNQVISTSANAVDSAATASEYVILNTPNSADVAIQVWREVRNDALLLELGNNVFGTVLESNRQTDLSITRAALLQSTRSTIGFSRDGSDGNWGLWLDWYEHILPDQRKSLFGEKVDVELANQMDGFWEGDPDEVMERVAALVGWPLPPQDEDFSDIEIPPQSVGTRFVLRDGKISIGETLHDETDWQRVNSLHPILSDLAEELTNELGKGNAAHSRLADLAASYKNEIDKPVNEINFELLTGLGLRLANAEKAAEREIEDREKPTLEDHEKEAIASFLDLHGPFVLATSSGQRLLADSHAWTRDQSAEAEFRGNVALLAEKLADAPDIAEPAVPEVIRQAGENIGKGPNPERGSAFGFGAVKNVLSVTVVSGAYTVAGLGLASGNPLIMGVSVLAVLAGNETIKKTKLFKENTESAANKADEIQKLSPDDVVQLKKMANKKLLLFVLDNETLLRDLAGNRREFAWVHKTLDWIKDKHHSP